MSTRKPSKISYAILVMGLITLVVGFYNSILPKSAGADEPSHQATAWYAIENLTLPEINYSSGGHIPNSLLVSPCYVSSNQIPNTKCMNVKSLRSEIYESAAISNYAFPYYLIVGLGQKIAIAMDWNWAATGGRISSALLNLIILMLSLKLHYRQSNKFAISLYVSLTPMVLFYFSVVNPSGWEISTSILFISAAINFMGNSEHASRKSKIWLVFSSILFATSRPLALIWLILICFIIYVTYKFPKQRLKIFLNLQLPAVILALLWNLMHRPGLMSLPGHMPLESVNYKHLTTWLFSSLNLVPEYFKQMVGVLGWGDVAISPFLSFAWLVIFAFFLGKHISDIRRSAYFLVILFSGLIIIPSLVQTYYWNSWPAWWQGRYELPFLVPALIILILNARMKIQEVKFYLTVTFILNLYMQIFSLLRYGLGLNQNGFPNLKEEFNYSNKTLALALSLLIVQMLIFVYMLYSTSIFTMQTKNRRNEPI